MAARGNMLAVRLYILAVLLALPTLARPRAPGFVPTLLGEVAGSLTSDDDDGSRPPGTCADLPGGKAPSITAAYYINRAKDTQRNDFMQRTLREAGIEAVRVPAIEPPVSDFYKLLHEREGTKYADSEFMQMAYSQRRCRRMTEPLEPGGPRQPLLDCMHPVTRSPLGCPHWSSYGSFSNQLRSSRLSRTLCGQLAANFLSGLRAVRMIQEWVNAKRTGKASLLPPSSPKRSPLPDEHYFLLMEDDSKVLSKHYRERFCQFLVTFPPHTWDIAKVDVDARDLNPRAMVGWRANLYRPAELAQMRADPDVWLQNSTVDTKRVPLVFGMAAVLLRESALPHVLNIFEEATVRVTDMLIGVVAKNRTLRVAVSRQKLCNSENAMQTATTLNH